MSVALFAIFVTSALAQITCGNCAPSPPSPPVLNPPTTPPPPAFVRRWCDMRGDWRANTDTVVRKCRRNAQNMYFCSQVGTGAVWRDAELTKAFVNSTNLYHAAYKQPVPGQAYYKWYKMIFLFPTGAATTSLVCNSIQLKNFQTGAIEQTWTRVLPTGSTVHAPVAQTCEAEAGAHAESDWKNAAVAAHNYWRCLYPGTGLVRVTWNQVIADQLAGVNGKVNVCGGMVHTASQYLAATATMPAQGENLATVVNMDPSGVPLYDPANPTAARWSTAMRAAVDLWAEERVNWNGPTYAPTSCRAPLIDARGLTCPTIVGHFTQVVWKTPPPTHPTMTTKAIGCVLKYCPQATGQPLHWARIQIGCRYLPAGNWVSTTTPYRPYEEAELENTYLGLNLSSLPHSSLLVAALGVALVSIMAAVVVVVRRRRTAHAALDEELLAVDEAL